MNINIKTSQQKYTDPALLDDLRRRIRKLERRHPGQSAPTVLPFGIAKIDAALPWGGLPLAGLHDVIARRSLAAATGFSAALLGRAIEGGSRTVLWCHRGRDLYGPGLAALGLGPDRLVVVRASCNRNILWAMEEGLRSGSLTAVVGEPGKISATSIRRLQLASETGTTAAILIRSEHVDATSGPAVTRWRVAAAPSRYPLNRWSGPPRWQVELLRCRAGALARNRSSPSSDGAALKGSGSWLVEWREGRDDETWEGRAESGFALAAELCHRPAAAETVGSRVPAIGHRRAI